MDPRLPIGTNYCKCSSCGEYFTGEKAFTRHRVRKDQQVSCLPPVDMSERGFYPVSRGAFTYWGGPGAHL